MDLRTFTRAADLAHQTGSRLDPGLFEDLVISALYRLLHADSCLSTLGPMIELSEGAEDEDENKGHVQLKNEILRLGMIAFASGLFFNVEQMALGFQAMAGRSLDYLVQSRKKMDCISVKYRQGPTKLLMWFALMCYVSYDLSSEQDGILYRQIECMVADSGQGSWEEIRDVLGGVLWLGACHEGAARCLVERAKRSGLEEGQC
jgi:hypothetical protein